MPGHDTADRLRHVLEGVEGLVSAYLFGSIPEGRAHRQSDVDVGVLLDRAMCPSAGERFEARLVLLGLLTRATGREVDLVVLNDAPPQLARHIMCAGQPLVIADATRRAGASQAGALQGRRPRAFPPARPGDQVAGVGPMTYLVERFVTIVARIERRS